VPTLPNRVRDRAARWKARLTLPLLLGLAFAGCQPASTGPTPAEAAAEALKAQGAREAQVQMQAGSFRATLTQGDGRTALVSVGVDAVMPADLGVPWYPGATPDPVRTSKVSNADGHVATVLLNSADRPERVLDFYRERITAVPGGAVLESRTADGAASLVLADDGRASATQIVVAATPTGSEITLLTTRRAPR
jgi:hypothetical protein